MVNQHAKEVRSGGPVAFWATFVLFFAVTVVFLAAVDALPEPQKVAQTQNSAPSQSQTHTAIEAPQSNPEKPIRVSAPTIGLNTTVSNPVSTDVHVLDQALLKGAVRYPTSALLGVNGTVFLFGHSSYLPVVHNQAYKAFNRIQNLKNGDTVSVYSDTLEYRYKVTGVRVADATEDVVELPTTGKHLVLVTCDSFTKKTSRFVVTADFVGTYALRN